MQFKPYYNSNIYEKIETIEEDELHRKLLASDEDEIDLAVADYNVEIQINPNFGGSHYATVMKKTILYRQRQLLHTRSAKTSASSVLGSLFGNITLLAGSLALGEFTAKKTAEWLRLSADTDKVNKLLE